MNGRVYERVGPAAVMEVRIAGAGGPAYDVFCAACDLVPDVGPRPGVALRLTEAVDFAHEHVLTEHVLQERDEAPLCPGCYLETGRDQSRYFDPDLFDYVCPWHDLAARP